MIKYKYIYPNVVEEIEVVRNFENKVWVKGHSQILTIYKKRSIGGVADTKQEAINFLKVAYEERIRLSEINTELIRQRFKEFMQNYKIKET